MSDETFSEVQRTAVQGLVTALFCDLGVDIDKFISEYLVGLLEQTLFGDQATDDDVDELLDGFKGFLPDNEEQLIEMFPRFLENSRAALRAKPDDSLDSEAQTVEEQTESADAAELVLSKWSLTSNNDSDNDKDEAKQKEAAVEAEFAATAAAQGVPMNDPSLQMLCDMFPDASPAALWGHLRSAISVEEAAAQVLQVMELQEEGTMVDRRENVAIAPNEEDVKAIQAHAMKYAMVEDRTGKADRERTYKPAMALVVPKASKIKVRFRDGMQVTSKGERFIFEKKTGEK